MAIKNRQGKSQDFVPTKLLGGEFAVVQEGDKNTADGSALYLATKAGSVKRIPFAGEVDDLKTKVDEVVEDAREAIESAIDPTLMQSGKAADAKKTGDEIADLKSDFSEIIPGLSDEAKIALLACFEHVAWINENGQTYYDNLEAALYDDYPKITATFAPGSNTIYTDDGLDALKQYLTVKYYTSKTDTGITIPAASYTLSGVLGEGKNTVRVTYLDDYKAKFIVNAVDFYNIHEWSESNGLAISKGNIVTEYTTTIVSNETSTNRGIAYCGRGKKDIYKYNSGNLVSFDPKKYPIPMPVGTKRVTMTYIGSFLANLNLYKYNENTDTYTYNGQPTYTERTNGTVSFETNVQDENNFVMPLFLIGSAGVLPTDVNLTFSLD